MPKVHDSDVRHHHHHHPMPPKTTAKCVLAKIPCDSTLASTAHANGHLVCSVQLDADLHLSCDSC